MANFEVKKPVISKMKIFFVRHGEAMDDVRNEYGGWHDPELAPAGIESAEKTAQSLKSNKLNVSRILSSPLKRARQTAGIISNTINLPVEINVYLKERNTYGLLCGVNKDEAKGKYPELVAAYEAGEKVLGYENYEFFLKRVRVLIEQLGKINQDIICVTHGKMLGAIFKDVLGREAKKIQESCLIEMELTEGKLRLVGSEGVELK